MWNLVRQLRDKGCTIILTTHYIEEAEEMADRVGVIRKGELVVVEEKRKLMERLGKKHVTFALSEPLKAVPEGLGDWDIALTRMAKSCNIRSIRMPSARAFPRC